jgi:catechol 2,3-dioxygenase-like lactoylglutathione lyase family enzyme
LLRKLTLSDAQGLIAKRAGFENGEALLKGVHTMNEIHSEILAKPTLLAAEPQLFVTDVVASCEYYTKKLGFKVAFIHGEPPFYGQVVRDGARLNLRSLPEPAINPELRGREHLLSASITLDDAKPLFLEFQAAGVAFHQVLKTEPWGARTFIVCDPDGNLILFSGRGR